MRRLVKRLHGGVKRLAEIRLQQTVRKWTERKENNNNLLKILAAT